ncbi:hypothetical protein VULLAG_LOCUS2925 [Vulpes lagopus]
MISGTHANCLVPGAWCPESAQNVALGPPMCIFSHNSTRGWCCTGHCPATAPPAPAARRAQLGVQQLAQGQAGAGVMLRAASDPAASDPAALAPQPRAGPRGSWAQVRRSAERSARGRRGPRAGGTRAPAPPRGLPGPPRPEPPPRPRPGCAADSPEVRAPGLCTAQAGLRGRGRGGSARTPARPPRGPPAPAPAPRRGSLLPAAAAAATGEGPAGRGRGRPRLLSQAGRPGGPRAPSAGRRRRRRRRAPGRSGPAARAAATKPGSRRPLAGRPRAAGLAAPSRAGARAPPSPRPPRSPPPPLPSPRPPAPPPPRPPLSAPPAPAPAARRSARPSRPPAAPPFPPGRGAPRGPGSPPRLRNHKGRPRHRGSAAVGAGRLRPVPRLDGAPSAFGVPCRLEAPTRGRASSPSCLI